MIQARAFTNFAPHAVPRAQVRRRAGCGIVIAGGEGAVVLGIDLGSASARAAYGVGPEVVPVRVADPSGGLGALVSFAVEPPRFGHAALGYLVTDPKRSLRNLTRYLCLSRAVAEPGGPRVQHSVGDGKVTLDFGGVTLSAAELVGRWLSELHAQASAQAGVQLQQAVVAFPLSFDHLAHAQLEQALEKSALGETAPILAPVAAAVGLCPSGPERDVVIVDVGANELSVCKLHLYANHEALPQLDHAEREPIGGDAVDAELVALAEHSLGATFQGPVREMVRQYCQTLKHELSNAASASCLVPGYLLGRPDGVQLAVSAAELERCLERLLVLVEASVERLRSAARLGLGAQVELYVIGGSTRLASVRSRIEQVFGVPARHVRDPGHAIAFGCARIGALHGAALREAANTPRLTLPPAYPIRGSSEPPGGQVPELRAPKAPPLPADLAALAAEPARTLDSDRAPRRVSEQRIPAQRPSSPSAAPPAQRRPSEQRIPAQRPSSPSAAPPAQRRPSEQRIPAQRPSSPSAAPAAQPPPSWTPPRERAASDSTTPRAPSQPVIVTTARTVAPPGASRTSIAPSDLKGGAVRNAVSPEDFLRLPLARPPTLDDLDPASLPMLFMVLRHPSRFGTLSVEMQGMESLRFQVADGMAFLGGLEHKRVLEAFRVAHGRYTLEVKPYKEQANKEAHMMMSLLVDGMNETVKRFQAEAMIAALGDRMQRAPFVGPRSAKLISKLPLSPMEQRIVKYSFAGQEAAQQIVDHLGVRRQATLGLMMLLSVYDLIEWHEPPQTEAVSLEDTLNARAAEMMEANFFQVLGLHWSALDEEVDEAYEKLLSELGPGQPVHAAAPAACEKMLSRVHEAYDILSDATRRVHYRRQAYPNLDMASVADFLKKKEAAWALRADGAAEVEKARRKREALKQQRRKPPA